MWQRRRLTSRGTESPLESLAAKAVNVNFYVRQDSGHVQRNRGDKTILWGCGAKGLAVRSEKEMSLPGGHALENEEEEKGLFGQLEDDKPAKS